MFLNQFSTRKPCQNQIIKLLPNLLVIDNPFHTDQLAIRLAPYVDNMTLLNLEEPEFLVLAFEFLVMIWLQGIGVPLEQGEDPFHTYYQLLYPKSLWFKK